MRLFSLMSGAALTLLALAGSAAAATTVTVDSTDDIFLASQPTGVSVTGYFGTDTAPANSPVAIAVAPGDGLTFSATGSTSVDDSCFAGPDGGCYSNESGFSPAPASNTYRGPSDALIGVFLPSGVTSVQNGLTSLNYAGDPALETAGAYSPQLDQIFFIGDGLTGTASGSTQSFFAPSGAVTLYIATADSIGASTGNLGSLSVTYADSPGEGGVPEPAAWSLMLAGFGGLGLALRGSRRRRAVAA